jgi:DUF4097 and DUF4098 domain-containing protein YvlB
MRQLSLLGVLLVLVAGTGCDVAGNGDVTATERGASTVNGSIHVPAGLHSGALGTVNGSIHIDDNASVGSASTVNGSIDMGAKSSANSLSAVNGGIVLGSDARVSGGATTVNGEMSLKSGAEVGGALRNVNGHITLNGAHVAGGLRTVGGDIDITGPSRVEGGIHVEKSGGWFNLDTRKPRIVIGPGAVVDGELRFDRDVQLYVSDKATVGSITGATAVRFRGAQPTG